MIILKIKKLFNKRRKNYQIVKEITKMIILFFIFIIILLAVFYYEVRFSTSKISKNTFSEYNFFKTKFMSRDIFIISPKDENSNNKKQCEAEMFRLSESRKVILYLHGGSYVGELEKYHWNFFKDIVNETQSTIIIPDYPLAPEHTYMEVFKIMEPLYKKIIENMENKEFILMGDSAGAGLALALYQRMGKLNYTLPNKTILISPWLDVRMNNPKIDEIDDPVLNKVLLKLSGKKYAGKNGMKSYLVNPVLGPTNKLENIYILSGTRDMLNPDAKKFAYANNDKITFLEYEDAIHNFVLMKHKKGTVLAKEGYDKVVEIILN